MGLLGVKSTISWFCATLGLLFIRRTWNGGSENNHDKQYTHLGPNLEDYRPRSWQNDPINPGGHSHITVSTCFMHVPLFSQKFSSQGDMTKYYDIA